MNHAQIIARQLNLGLRQVEKTVELLRSGATVPFIARYRKEATGSLNEVQVAAVRDMMLRLDELDKRRQTIVRSLAEQGVLNETLQKQLDAAETLTALDDIYLPFRPKRRTRATIAIEKGLRPLAEALVEAARKGADNDVVGGASDEQLDGARDLVAEWVSEDTPTRNAVRQHFERHAVLESTVARGVADDDERLAKYESWREWREVARNAPSHRVLALLRGEEAGVLRVRVRPDNDEPLLQTLGRQWHANGSSKASRQMSLAVADSYSRLLQPSIENEYRRSLKEKADGEAIAVFSKNLRQLLLAPPLGQKNVLAIDPGFRTGCKLVCLDQQGQLLHNETIYPFTSVREERAAIAKLEALTEAFHTEAIAIGNGTAGRETEELIGKCHFKQKLIAVVVNESGASVYSASDVARREFPDYDITVRGAVSIGRRLMDPLSELVKIDPKSIGVGQYQHDVDQRRLSQSLEQVVESCVNSVGVELNTASRELLTHVSGIGPVLASRSVDHRNQNGAFASREELKKVKGMGEKAFEQCAGFLRVRESKNPLDHSAVHPERYALVGQMAKSVGCSVEQLIANREQRSKIDLRQFVNEGCGLPTLNDILTELDKPGLDPRAKFEVLQFDKNITRIEDVKEGMTLPGIVTNITAFGAFVDIGVHQDGLVHISQMANHRVADPSTVVSLHQHVKVKVIGVDIRRRRISLSMKDV